MPELTALELKAFVPAKDFELSKQFYADLGFTLVWSAPDGSLAYFQVGPAKFMLQNHFVREAAEQLMLHLLVPDVEVWNARIHEQRLLERYPIRVAFRRITPGECGISRCTIPAVCFGVLGTRSKRRVGRAIVSA